MELKKLLLITSLLISSTAIASDNSHSLGLGYDFGTSDTSDSEQFSQLNDESVGQYNIFYNYHFNQYWAFELNYLAGDSESFSLVLDDIFTDSELEYDSIVFSIKGNYPVSNIANIYASIGINSYDYEMRDDNKVFAQKDGSDLTAAVGVEVKYTNGFGLYSQYRYLKFSSNLTTGLFGLGISYSF